MIYHLNHIMITMLKNIGDTLMEMTSMITSPISKLTKETFDYLTNYKPVINQKRY